MKNIDVAKNFDNQRGVALIEALIAIVIFSIAILGIIGLQVSMVRSAGDAKYRTEASFVAQQRLAQIWLDQGNIAFFGEAAPGTDISPTAATAADRTGLPAGRRITSRDGVDQTRFTVTITWEQPGTDEVHTLTTVGYISNS